MPAAQARGKVPDRLVWHCVVSAADTDPPLADGSWQPIIAEMMHRTGLSVRGDEVKGVRWVAVHHGGNHVHVVATLARMDGRPVSIHSDYNRVQEAMAWAEREYGLTSVAQAGPRGTAARRPTRAEAEKAVREQAKADLPGAPVTARVRLRGLVAAAAAAARTEEEFLAALSARGVTARPGEVTGYAFGLRSDTTGAGGGPVWFGGANLSPDLSLSRLRARWTIGPDRLSGRSMSGQAARPILAREALRAARAAWTEEEFFARLDRVGLLVSQRPDPARIGKSAGYAISLPGLGQAASRAGRAVWFSGGDLDQQLGLGRLRTRWAAGRTGTAPGPDMFDGDSTRQVYAYAAAVAQQAAADIRAARGRDRAAIAWAAADLITSAVEATGNPGLHRAADGFRRAARAPWGRALAARSPAVAMIRTAAYALAGCAPVDRRSAVHRALTLLARAITHMRRERMLREQARRVREERARGLRAVARDPQAPQRQPQVRSLQARTPPSPQQSLPVRPDRPGVPTLPTRWRPPRASRRLHPGRLRPPGGARRPPADNRK